MNEEIFYLQVHFIFTWIVNNFAWNRLRNWRCMNGLSQITINNINILNVFIFTNLHTFIKFSVNDAKSISGLLLTRPWKYVTFLLPRYFIVKIFIIISPWLNKVVLCNHIGCQVVSLIMIWFWWFHYVTMKWQKCLKS